MVFPCSDFEVEPYPLTEIPTDCESSLLSGITESEDKPIEQVCSQ